MTTNAWYAYVAMVTYNVCTVCTELMVAFLMYYMLTDKLLLPVPLPYLAFLMSIFL